MDMKDVFLQQLTACYDQNTWFVSLNNAIKGLTAEQASCRDGQAVNSIWGIVNHLAFYNQRYLNRFNSIPNSDGPESNSSTFKNIDEQTWESTVKLINEIMSGWRTSLEKSDDQKINDWALELAHLTLHNTYHIGQIVHIRKQKGIWDTKQGVD